MNDSDDINNLIPAMNPNLEKIRNVTMLVGEGAFDLGANLIVMILVQRSLGVGGLGIFSYLLSLQMLAGFMSDFGISGFLEREIAGISNKKKQEHVILNASRAMTATSLLCGLAFLAFAFSGLSLTRVDERAAAYIIIALTIAVRNFNALRIAVLLGRREYNTVATLKTFKRLFLLGAVCVFLLWGFGPSYLMLAYLAGEAGLTALSFKKIRLPDIKTLLMNVSTLGSTLKESAGFILTDEALDVIFYMDFLILGMFVSSDNLGVYAQASIMARMFLLIPISIKPLFRGQYCMMASQNRLEHAVGPARLSAAFLFYLHAVLALYMLLFYTELRHSLLHAYRFDMTSFYIFAEILPGLLFFSAITSQEPLYEAEGKAGALQKLIMVIAVVNLCLNLFCIPFAGFYGAAFATCASMFVYFLLFGRYLGPVFRIYKTNFIFAGAAVYLTYMLFQYLDWGMGLSFFAVPFFLYMLLSMMGFFDVHSENDFQFDEVMRFVRNLRLTQPETGGFDEGRQ